jgi:hypothetical protein
MAIGFKQIALVVVFLVVAPGSGSRALGQQAAPAKPGPPAVIKWNGDLAYILSHMTNAYEVTIGFEVDPQQPKADVGFYLLEPTLPDVLNAIVQSAPRYEWRERDGFFEVRPLAGSSPLLDTMIHSFRVNDVDQAEALNQLMSLPELQVGMKAMKLTRQEISSASTEQKTQKFSLSLEGVTLRHALNQIVQASGGRFWIFRRPSDRSFSISSAPG